jgi:hypothetical protein
MRNQNTSSIEEIAGQSLGPVYQQISLNVETHTGWPEPTTTKKSDFTAVSPAEGRH